MTLAFENYIKTRVGWFLFVWLGEFFLPQMVSGDKHMVSRQNFVWTRMYIERRKK